MENTVLPLLTEPEYKNIFSLALLFSDVFVVCRFVKNLCSGKDGWVAAANLLSLISESKSSQSLSSSGQFRQQEAEFIRFCFFLSQTHAVVVCGLSFFPAADGSVSGNLSTSSSCSETYTSFSDIKP